MISLLRYPYNAAPGKGNPTSQQNDSKHNVHSKQSSSYTQKSTVDQATLIPGACGFHNVFNDWVKKLGLLLSASRSK